MRLEWLEDILAVAQTGSFSEAAERRNLTQSAFSRRIGTIETSLGVELFDRSRKPVQLRAATKTQQETIGRLAGELRQLQTDLRRGDVAGANRIIIASQHALTTALAPPILQGIQARREDTYVRLRSANLDECFALLLARQADIALVYRVPGEAHPISAAYIETAMLGKDRLIPVIANTAVALFYQGMARGEVPFIAYPPEVFMGRIMQTRILPNISLPMPKAETALTLAALEMAAVGVAVAWVPASLARQRIDDGRLVDLSAVLPVADLEVTAVRLIGTADTVALSVWSHLTDRAPDQAADGAAAAQNFMLCVQVPTATADLRGMSGTEERHPVPF